MKLLFFTRKIDVDDPRIGFVHEWVARLSHKVDRLYVLCLEAGKTDLPDNVEVVILGKGKLRRMLRFNKVMPGLVKNVDAVFCHMNPIYAIMSTPYTKLFNKRLVLWYTHGSVTNKLKIATTLVDKILTASPESFRIETKKKCVLGHGIDTALFKPGGPPDKISILSVGRISRVKGYETLIDALPSLLSKFPDLRLKIIGGVELSDEKAYLQQLRERASRLGIADKVYFEGGLHPSKLPDLYRSSSLFVSNSRTGSLDKVVLEAMASGTPVLTSNEAFSNIVGSLSSELMFKQDDPQDLASKASYLLAMPLAERTALTTDLRAIVERNHDLNSLIDKILEELKR